MLTHWVFFFVLAKADQNSSAVAVQNVGMKEKQVQQHSRRGLAGAGLVLALFLSACDSAPTPLRMEVTLDKQCELLEAAFMVVTEPYGTKADFERGKAVLTTYSDAKVFLKSHDRYPSFHFESPKVQAAPRLTLTARCDEGERIDRTLDAMRGQFGTKR